MKKILSFLLFLSTCLLAKAQEKNYDTVAIMILDRMSDVIGDLSSCSFTLHTTTDRIDTGNMITYFGKDEVYLAGPDKMQVSSWGEKGHRAFYYDDSVLTFYSFDENNYATIGTPSTIVETIDSVNNAYGITFPAADFFYPTFSDDILNFADTIDYLGQEDIMGKQCFHILAKGKDMTIQLWIANDATTLPEKFVINYTNNKKDIQRYEAGFSNWKLNPDLPGAMFDFLPPPSAHEVYLLPKNESPE